MATLEVSAPLRVSAEEAWDIIGDFASLAQWHPLVPNCRPTADGQGRIITLPGHEVIETLIPGASPPLGHTYTVARTPMPITDYRATLRLQTTESGCRIVYQGRFTPVGVSEARAQDMLRRFFEAGFAALQTRLDTSES